MDGQRDGQMDEQTDRQTDVQIFALFYRNLSPPVPSGATAQKVVGLARKTLALRHQRLFWVTVEV